MVERGQHRNRRPGRQRRVRVRDQRREPRMGGRKIVQPAGGEELALRAEHGGGLGVRDDDVVAADLRRVHLRARDAVRQQAQQVLTRRVAQPVDRVHVLLLVQDQPLVHGAVQVDGQLREPQQRPRGGEVLGAVPHHQAPGELQFAVQPGVEQGTAVDLDAGLQPPELARGGFGLELERRRIGVRTQDVEPGGGTGRPRRHPGDDRAVADDVGLPCAAAGGRVPGLELVKGGESCLVKPAGGLVDGMEARRRRGNVCAEVLDVGGGVGL